MIRKPARAAVASSPEVEAAADELLAKGNAVDAAVAGAFAACATSPGVLLGPMQILVGGGGLGLRALDGRVRQPGVGAPRPRGFKDDEEVPDAARVGVPWLPATLSAAVATAGTATFKHVMGPALALAKGSPRHDVLAKIAARGARAIEERPLSSELLALAGRASGGLLTGDDLASPRPEVHRASRRLVPGAGAGPRSKRAMSEPASNELPRAVIELPWANDLDGMPAAPAAYVDVASARAVLAVDRHGAFAIAVWAETHEGIALGELGLRAPFFAEPVRRGQTRVRPGDARPAAAPIAMVGTEVGPEVAFAAFGAGDAYDVLRGAIRSLLDDDRIEAHGEARLVALSHAQGAASVFR
ncbi:MAG: gamma-glutamyltransferase [Labilithrix sp.]|nr:gamma-glutamyltransferase [Labilithrix sp.]